MVLIEEIPSEDDEPKVQNISKSSAPKVSKSPTADANVSSFVASAVATATTTTSDKETDTPKSVSTSNWQVPTSCSTSTTPETSFKITNSFVTGDPYCSTSDLYTVLNTSPMATATEIDDHYRSAITAYTTEELITAVRQRQVEKPAETPRQAALMDIMQAYHILSDSALRADYDLQRKLLAAGVTVTKPLTSTSASTQTSTASTTTTATTRSRIVNETKRQETAELRAKEQAYQQQRQQQQQPPALAAAPAPPVSDKLKKDRQWETQRERVQKLLDQKEDDLLCMLDEQRFGKKK